jgi:lanthanide-dependent methanol dehydrogenase
MGARRFRSALPILFAITLIPHARDKAWAQPATGATPPAAGAEWTTPAGTVQGTRFSSLTEINRTNVSRLQEEFRFSTGVVAGHEGQPLVVNGTMYVVTPFPNKLVALDLAGSGDGSLGDGDNSGSGSGDSGGGRVKWVFDPRPDPFAEDKACCDIVNRGAAYHPRDPKVSTSVDKIIFNVLDNTTVAVNARTGREIWRRKMGDPEIGQTMTMAPLVVRNRVFVGNSGAELGVRGFIAALDAETGKEVWRAWSTGPDTDVRIVPGTTLPFYAKEDPVARPNQGVTTWPPTFVGSGPPLPAWKLGGSTVWAWLTYDPELDLLFHGTANPGVWNPDMRPGENKWSTTMFARDPESGVARYMYQMTPHDGWDYDGVNENIVADVGGQKLVVRFDRNGFAYAHDRTLGLQGRGRIINARPYVPTNWATAIDLVTGLPVLDPAKQTKEGVNVLDICPAVPGGKDQQPAAFSPRTALFYVPTNQFCMDYHALKATYMAGAPFVGSGVQVKPAGFAAPERVEQRGFGPPVTFPVPCGREFTRPDGKVERVNCGEFIAWNALTGTKQWGIPERFPVWSGVLATASDLVFYGTMDRWFKAVDATTGEVVFQKQLPSGIIGNPITFLGPDGKQRIAVWSGVGGWAGALVPHEFSVDDPSAITGVMRKLPEFTPPGDTLHVFKIGS